MIQFHQIRLVQSINKQIDMGFNKFKKNTVGGVSSRNHQEFCGAPSKKMGIQEIEVFGDHDSTRFVGESGDFGITRAISERQIKGVPRVVVELN